MVLNRFFFFFLSDLLWCYCCILATGSVYSQRVNFDEPLDRVLNIVPWLNTRCLGCGKLMDSDILLTFSSMSQAQQMNLVYFLSNSQSPHEWRFLTLQEHRWIYFYYLKVFYCSQNSPEIILVSWFHSPLALNSVNYSTEPFIDYEAYLGSFTSCTLACVKLA